MKRSAEASHGLIADAADSSYNLFTKHFGIQPEEIQKILETALSKGGEFSELFFEFRILNTLMMEENIVKTASENIDLGVGIRVIKHEQTGFAFTNDLSYEGMQKAANTAASVASIKSGRAPDRLCIQTMPHQVYDLERPICGSELDVKLDLVRAAHDAIQHYDSRIVMARSFLLDEMQHVMIANSEGLMAFDSRPLCALYCIAAAGENGRQTSGLRSSGGRVGINHFIHTEKPEQTGKLAAEEAVILLNADDAPAGEQPVILGAGQSGVMIHEAVGHPFESDGIRKKTSIFHDKYGQMIARPIVTIFDDATIQGYRGSLNMDDEGEIAKKTVLVEKGRLAGFIHDKLNAKLMGETPTGNGRRESYQYFPIPRMTNTVLARGESAPEEIIRSVKKGFYAKSFQGGQVSDAGKFTFSVNLGYLIENGKLTRPLRNATLIGTNIQILNEVSMIGNDMGFFLGNCGKGGQTQPVTAGTPTLKIEKMTVGGRG